MIKNLNLLIRFTLEVVSLISLGFWGFKIGESSIAKYCLGIGIPLVIAFIWGVFGSPKAIWQLSKPFRWALVFAIYILSAFALFNIGQKNMSIIFMICVIINSILMYIWDQQ